MPKIDSQDPDCLCDSEGGWAVGRRRRITAAQANNGYQGSTGSQPSRHFRDAESHAAFGATRASLRLTRLVVRLPSDDHDQYTESRLANGALTLRPSWCPGPYSGLQPELRTAWPDSAGCGERAEGSIVPQGHWRVTSLAVPGQGRWPGLRHPGRGFPGTY